MSFQFTVKAFQNQDKDVTRRAEGTWQTLKAGDRLMGVEKAMGLKRGEKQKALGEVEVVSVRLEPLDSITQADVIREGFPDMNPSEFVAMFVRDHAGVTPSSMVRRIEFRHCRPITKDSR
jgi:hypothetical protein